MAAHERRYDPDPAQSSQWTVEADTGDLAATAPGLLLFVSMKQNLQPGSGRMNLLLFAGATFLIPSSLKCLPELLGSRCQQSPSMCLDGGKLPCTTSRSMCTMSCA